MSDADVQARLRAYREAVARREVSPEAWPRLQRRLRREPWRRAGLAAAAVAMAVAVITIGPGLAARWAGREPAPAARPSQPTVAARIPLGCTLSQAARNLEVGFGAVWVACDGALIRVDPATNQIAAVIPLQAMTAGAGIAFSDDSVWVTSASSTQPFIYQIDPASNREVTRTPLPGDANGIAIAEGTIWVALEGSELDTTGPGTVARLDADTGGRLPPVELPRPPTGIRSGLGAVWVTTYRTDESAVYRIDPRSATLTRVPRAQGVVAAGAGALWVTTDNPPTAIHQIDPATGRVVATVPDPEIKRMAYGSEALWALTDARLYRLDPSSARVVGAPVALPPDSSGGLAVGEGGIWVAEQGTETAITRLNLPP